MTRLTDNDKHFGPLTYAKASWTPWRLVLSSGDEEDSGNSLTAYAFGWVVRLRLPVILQPYRERYIAKCWDAETIARMGRNWYYHTFPREYGFSLHDGFLQLFLGAQTHDSSTTQDWCWSLPWTQWRFVRRSFYDLDGQHFWTEPRDIPRDRAFEEKMCDAVPKAIFEFDDFDGQRITATTCIEEREWRFGEGWFRWLSIFRGHKVQRSLDIRFSEQVGPEKGSWKGGTLGHGINMLKGELHEAAFRRYCAEHGLQYVAALT